MPSSIARQLINFSSKTTVFFKKLIQKFAGNKKSRTFATLFGKAPTEKPRSFRQIRDVVQLVSILGLGPSGRTFESCHPDQQRALSSAGSERLPYKQRVGGSNPSAPTSGKNISHMLKCSFLFSARKFGGYEQKC